MDNEQKEKIFANGLMFKERNPAAPEYVLGSLWVKVDEFIAFLQANNTNNGGINIDIKRSIKGNIYCELNTWKPSRPAFMDEGKKDEIEYPEEDINPDDIPF